MHIKVLFTCLFLFSIILPICSQSDTAYKNLKNEGVLPKDFLTLSSAKYNKDIKQVDKKRLKRKEKKTQKDFYLNSNFLVDDLLRSGQVLFETEYSSYLKSITEVVLKNKPEVVKNLKIYLLKSHAVNAFATQDGSIFVTIGLLTKVENEAQLAYILSHEVIHVTHKHALAIAMEADKFNKTDKTIFKKKD